MKTCLLEGLLYCRKGISVKRNIEVSKSSQLLEGITDIVYHTTDLNSLHSILGSNSFRLSSSIGAQSDDNLKPKAKYYFFSTARSPNGSYGNRGYHRAVMLVLNGQKLGQKYAAKPVDYWGRDFRLVKPDKAEMEDRIWSDKPIIPNASQYILEIHTYIENESKWEGDADDWRAQLRRVWIESKKRNIPMFVYTDMSAYQLLDKRKAVTPDQIELKVQNPGNKWPKADRRGQLTPWMELYYLNDYSKLADRTKSKLRYIMQPGFGFNDQLASLEADLHNYKKDPVIDKFVQILKKEKIQTAKQFLELIAQKWSKMESLAKTFLDKIEEEDDIQEDVGSVVVAGASPNICLGLAAAPFLDKKFKKKKKNQPK
jgi:hypothetical protein